MPVGLGTKIGGGEVLMGRFGCLNCSSTTGYFAFLVIAFGVVVFGVFVARQRRQSSAPPTEEEEERVAGDQEGWETKVSDSGDSTGLNESKEEENWQAKVPEGDETTDTGAPGEEEGWETKPEN